MDDKAKVTKSDAIRALAVEGLSTTAIAQKLGIRYQHAYNVIRGSGPAQQQRQPSLAIPKPKPSLSLSTLLDAGFKPSGQWTLSDSMEPIIEGELPKAPGLYAFSVNEQVQYVGVTAMGLRKRLYRYGRPGPTQTTNIRLKEIIRKELLANRNVLIITAEPPDADWNGLPVMMSAGIELGIIRQFSLPWNIRSAK